MVARIATLLVFIATAAAIVYLGKYSHALNQHSALEEEQSNRMALPRVLPAGVESIRTAEDSLPLYPDTEIKMPLADNEILTAILTGNFDADPSEEQIIAYRNIASARQLQGLDSVYITYIDFDESSHTYSRLWDKQTGAQGPEISLYNRDIIGDRSICILVAGLTISGEHSLTIFRSAEGDGTFEIIADLHLNGTITIEEKERTQAYQMGLTKGQSFALITRGPDNESPNMLDKVEITYTYNAQRNQYEQSKVLRIPNTQIEQQGLRDLLRGGRAKLEQFIDGLWYFVAYDGRSDKHQYLYFNKNQREIIFYDREVQQVFRWQTSTATQYGLSITSANMSVTTLFRSIDVEIDSFERIQVKVFEDVKLRIGMNVSWDGFYRRLKTYQTITEEGEPFLSYRSAYYTSTVGDISLSLDTSYTLRKAATQTSGFYSFFMIDEQEAVEFRPGIATDSAREVYTVETSSHGTVLLRPVYLDIHGIHQTTGTLVVLSPLEAENASDSG
ncbi:MAG: pallilysin-related adhesin [Spirochaetaceae bacterium]|jgi:hypothetical protein|nr:pallilysin-related adhesin [Spirochaetaceae bacterium]